MTAPVKPFRIKTALKDEARNAQIRTSKSKDGWEAQVYLLPPPGADRALTHEERMGAPVLFRVLTEQEALDGMMEHLKKYFRLEIQD